MSAIVKKVNKLWGFRVLTLTTCIHSAICLPTRGGPTNTNVGIICCQFHLIVIKNFPNQNYFNYLIILVSAAFTCSFLSQKVLFALCVIMK